MRKKACIARHENVSTPRRLAVLQGKGTHDLLLVRIQFSQILFWSSDTGLWSGFHKKIDWDRLTREPSQHPPSNQISNNHKQQVVTMIVCSTVHTCLPHMVSSAAMTNSFKARPPTLLVWWIRGLVKRFHENFSLSWNGTAFQTRHLGSHKGLISNSSKLLSHRRFEHQANASAKTVGRHTKRLVAASTSWLFSSSFAFSRHRSQPILSLQN